MTKVQNAKTLPKVYFGLHMLPGVAEYREPEQKPYRIFLNERTIKGMDASFQGRPLYVRHKDEVNLENLQHEADGYVVRSFYNSFDGKHWAEFIVVSDRGHEALAKGWRLSNAYIPTEFATGGLWNGVEYQKEVTRAEYEHLAIVPNPRYDESIILTPEQFKEYNQKKELELKRLTNSKGKGDHTVKFNWFKKNKVENEQAADLEGMTVVLPKSKREVSIETLVNEADAVANMAGYANGEHMVKVGDDEMTVNALVEKYGAMCNDKKKNDDLSAKDKATENADDKDDKDKKDEKKENAADDKSDKKVENAADVKAKKDEGQKNFDALKNAADKAQATKNEVTVETTASQLARGKSRYGSGK